MKMNYGSPIWILLLVCLCIASSVKGEGFNITQMVADLKRPFIYALEHGQSGIDDTLLIISVKTEQVIKTLPIGVGATDMSINYEENRLYISNWPYEQTRVVDLNTQVELPSLELGTDVYKLNAGRSGRLFYEEEDQWIYIRVFNTETGTELDNFPVREGDGEADPTGNYYYHCDNNSSNARLHKFDVSTDTLILVKSSDAHSFGTRNLVMSGDGSHLFWHRFIFDSDLNELGYLGTEIYATTFHGDLAFSSTQVFNINTGDVIHTLPFSTNILTVSGDQEKLFLFDENNSEIVVIPMSRVADKPGLALNPIPTDGQVAVLPVDTLSWDINPLTMKYDIYFGDDENVIANASTNSEYYFGSVIVNQFALSKSLELGKTYYWRVDQVGFSDVSPGSVWSFTVAPIVVTPNKLHFTAVTNIPDFSLSLELSSGNTSEIWGISESIPWLRLDHNSGTTPYSIDVIISTSGLSEGLYIDSLLVTSGSYQFVIPVQMQLVALNLTQMVTDYERPYIYGLHGGSIDYGEFRDAFLAFISTETDQIERAIPIGSYATDMSINYGEDRLYVTNQYKEQLRVVDLVTQEELRPMELGFGIHRINAGRSGRIYYENEWAWENYIHVIDTETESEVGSYHIQPGDAEVDPTGNYYYHCDRIFSNGHITKLDISTDNPVVITSVPTSSYASLDLLMSGDGSRLFWRGYIYDSDLNELGFHGPGVYATTFHGDFAFNSLTAFNVHSGAYIGILPIRATVMAVSGDQEKLFMFNWGNREIIVVPMSDLVGISGPVLNPVPVNNKTIILPVDTLSWDINPRVLRYDIYFGDDETNVADADTTSAEYLGSVIEDHIEQSEQLEFGETYYWRVDQVGLFGTTLGEVWSFTVAPIVVIPNYLSFSTVTTAPDFSLNMELTSVGTNDPWEISESISWLSIDHVSGFTPDSVDITVSTVGLSEGIYIDTLLVTTGSYQFVIPVKMELITLNISKMVTDFERPYIYGLHRGSGVFDDAFLVFISTETNQIERVMSIGYNPTDMSINYGEDRLYVSNWLHEQTRVVDLVTQEELPSLELGTDVYKLNAGRPGRMYYEEENQWIDIHIIDTETGSQVGRIHGREGDGEIDPTGNYYYHCDNNISDAHIQKYDISTDTPIQVATSLKHPYGSRNLVLSGDGSRLFWRGYVYDSDLNELGYLGSEIYTTTLHGSLAFSSIEVFNVHTGDVIYTLSDITNILTISGDQEKLFYFDENSHQIAVIPMLEIADLPSPELNPNPVDGATVVLPVDTLFWAYKPFLIRYDVYFGDDETDVADADTNSEEYYGSVIENHIELSELLELGKTYYWRVDQIGYTGITPGIVWSFTVAPILATPNNLNTVTVTSAPDITLSIELTSVGTTEAWEISESIPWLSMSNISGNTPDSVDVILSTLGLPEGIYIDSLLVTSGSYQFQIPVQMELITLELTKMLTDYERPYIYGLHNGSGNFDDAFLVFISTETDQIEQVISIGSNPTDMSINYGEDRLYVNNWLHEKTRVVDLVTQEELPSLELGTDVYKINAGRQGRIYYEESNQWVYVHIIDTETGSQVGRFREWKGDGEIDLTGKYYYHCDYGTYHARIYKYNITTDSPFIVATSLAHIGGSRNLVLSRDRNRLFWRGIVFDSYLNELGYLGTEIFATSYHGDLAISSKEVFNVYTGVTVYTLPVTTNVIAVSGDQEKLFLFDNVLSEIIVIPMSSIPKVVGKTVVVPDTINVIMANTLDPTIVEIYIGDFIDNYTVTDVSTTSLLVNGAGSPTDWEILDSYEDFNGAVLKLEIPVGDFLSGYGLVTDKVEYTATVHGIFEDAVKFIAVGTCYLIGRNSGDLNLDGKVNIIDVVFMTNILYNDGLDPKSFSIGDVNCDNGIDISDIVYLIDFVFNDSMNTGSRLDCRMK